MKIQFLWYFLITNVMDDTPKQFKIVVAKMNIIYCLLLVNSFEIGYTCG